MEHAHGHFEHLVHMADTIDVATVLSLTWFSFVMSWHCAAMCGPLVCARLSDARSGTWAVWRDAALYNLGRVFSYATLGAVVGAAIGSTADLLGAWMPMAGAALAGAFALILAVQGLFLLMNKEVFWVPAVVSRVVSNITKVGYGWSNRPMGAFVLGAVTSFLPCMTLSSAIAAAAMTGGALSGSLVMTGFVVGTLPVMFATPVIASGLAAGFSGFESRRRVSAALRRGAGVFLLVASGITVFRLFH